MTLVVTHAKVSGKPAGNDPNRVYGTHWDANHTLTGTSDASQLNSNVVQAVVNDTNVTGSIASQTLTLSWSGQLAETRGGTNQSTYTLGDTLYASAANTLSKLAGNTTSTKNFLTQTGTGTASAAPVWGTISATDIGSGAALTSSNDTNVTVTLGGTPASALLKAASITMGWTGQLGVTRGGTGLATVAQGDLLYASALNTIASLAKNTTATRYLANTGTSNAPNWDQVNLANGVTGNLPVGNLNGGTSASSSTFWRGDGTWATPAGGGTVTSVVANGVTITNTGTIPPPYGLVNHSLAVSASAGALTIALKDNAGNDPSATSPVNGYFRNVTGTTGSWTQLSVTAALSITLPSSSTLGVSSATAFRLWVVLFNDAATARLGVINCSTATTTAAQIFPLTEGIPASSTAVSAASTSAGVFYTGSAVTSKSYLIVGYVEWNATGLTAGTWTTTNLNFIQSFGPGIKKPGDEIQKSHTTTQTPLVRSTNSYATAITASSFTLSSAANLVDARWAGPVQCANGLSSGYIALFQDSTQLSSDRCISLTGATSAPSACFILHKPNTASSMSYTVQIRGDGTNTLSFPADGSGGGSFPFASIILTEIMG